MTLICSSSTMNLFDGLDTRVQASRAASQNKQRSKIINTLIQSPAIQIGVRSRGLNGLRVTRLFNQRKTEVEDILWGWIQQIDRTPVNGRSDSLAAARKISLYIFHDMKKLGEADARFFIAEDSQKNIQGIMQLQIEEGSALDIKNLVVAPTRFLNPERAVRGAGTMLVAKAAQVALLLEKNQILLEPVHSASSFYQALGFKDEGRFYKLKKDQFSSLPLHLMPKDKNSKQKAEESKM